MPCDKPLIKSIGVGLCLGSYGPILAWFISSLLVTIVRMLILSVPASLRIVTETSLPTVKPELPEYTLGFWLYNVTNLEEIKSGSVPSVTTHGPLMFDGYVTYYDVVFSEDESDVTYSSHVNFVFNTEISTGSPSDIVTHPNPVYLNLLSQAGFSQGAALKVAMLPLVIKKDLQSYQTELQLSNVEFAAIFGSGTDFRAAKKLNGSALMYASDAGPAVFFTTTQAETVLYSDSVGILAGDMSQLVMAMFACAGQEHAAGSTECQQVSSMWGFDATSGQLKAFDTFLATYTSGRVYAATVTAGGGATFATKSVHEWLFNFTDPILEYLTGDGSNTNFFPCIESTSLADHNEANALCDISTPVKWELYTGHDTASKWQTFKNFAVEDAIGLPSLPFPDPVMIEGLDVFTFPANDDFKYFDFKFMRVFPMEVLEQVVLHDTPLNRFVPSESILKPTGGIFNLTALGVPYLLNWGSRCGYLAGTRKTQVTSFVDGNVVGYPSCNFDDDAFHFDIDLYFGLPLQFSHARELSVIVADQADGDYAGRPTGPMQGEGQFIGPSGNYMMIPQMKFGLAPFHAPDEFVYFLFDFTYVAFSLYTTAATVFQIMSLTFLLMMCVSYGLMCCTGKLN